MKIIIVGAGSIGQRHLRCITSSLESIELALVRRRRRGVVLDRDNSVVSKVGVSSYYNIKEFVNITDAIKCFSPDAILIAGPTHTHFNDAVIALRAGLVTFVEKPVCESLEELDRLTEMEHKYGGKLVVGFQFRFHPLYRELKRICESGTLGSVLSAHFYNNESIKLWHPYEDYRDSYALRVETGGGSLLTQLHEVDLACDLFGDFRSVYAVGGKLSDLDGDAEDVVSILAGFTNTDLKMFPCTFSFDFIRSRPRRMIDITFNHGEIQLDLIKNSLRINRRDGRKELIRLDDYSRDDLFKSQLGGFLDCLKNGVEPINNVREARKSLLLITAAKKSLNDIQ